MITNSEQLSTAMNERTELECKMKTKRLDAMEQEKYTSLIYEIQEFLSNEKNVYEIQEFLNNKENLLI